MAYEFKLPDLGEGLTEGEVARWLVAEGQEIAEDDPLVEIQTDKATVEIPSPAAGVVSRILVAEGEVVPVGTVLVAIGSDASDRSSETDVSRGQTPSSEKDASVPAATGGKARATPLVRKVAQELGVDIDGLTGTGPQGRVTEEDVRSAAGSGGQTPEGRREPLRGVRRVIAEHMARAHREVPPVTWVEECDFEAVDMEKLVATVVKACADELQAFPELNARLDGDAIFYLDRYDIGVAVQTEQGLMVPVVRGCDAKTADEIHAELASLAERGREGTLAPEELRGSTFTVTSAGKLSGLFQTPIVNHPEVAILSIGRIAPRPVVRDGEVVIRRAGNDRRHVRPSRDRRRPCGRVRVGRHCSARMSTRAHVVARGRVQGVFFRAEARARARSLGVTGWVSNRPDGAVEAVFEGPEEHVASMVRWCEQGPAGARVDAAVVTWEQPTGDEGFEVR